MMPAAHVNIFALQQYRIIVATFWTGIMGNGTSTQSFDCFPCPQMLLFLEHGGGSLPMGAPSSFNDPSSINIVSADAACGAPRSLFAIVSIDGKEVYDGRVAWDLASRPVTIGPAPCDSNLQIHFFPALMAIPGDIHRSWSTVTMPISKLMANYGAPLYTSLWLGLGDPLSEETDVRRSHGLGLKEALRRAYVPSSYKVKMTLFKPNSNVGPSDSFTPDFEAIFSTAIQDSR